MIELDKYGEAIAYLREHPKEIVKAWSCGNAPDNHKGASLFKAVRPGCGCLTQVHHELFFNDAVRQGVPFALLTEIVNDPNIRKWHFEIGPDDLEKFAEWQIKLDGLFPERTALASTESCR